MFTPVEATLEIQNVFHSVKESLKNTYYLSPRDESYDYVRFSGMCSIVMEIKRGKVLLKIRSRRIDTRVLGAASQTLRNQFNELYKSEGGVCSKTKGRLDGQLNEAAKDYFKGLSEHVRVYFEYSMSSYTGFMYEITMNSLDKHLLQELSVLIDEAGVSPKPTEYLKVFP